MTEPDVPPRQDVLLVNPSSGDGGGPSPDELSEAASALGVDVVLLEPGGDLAATARDAAGRATALGMAGGDGSLGLVAAEAMRADIPFVCVPFGTRNHFALDLGLDRSDPLAALLAFDHRQHRTVDVAMAGERVVMNNLALGVYAEVVHSRDYRDAKLSEGSRITREMLRGDREPDHFVVTDPDGHAHVAPFSLVVANNSYATGARIADLGRRARLDAGVLQVSVIDTDSGWDLATLLWTATAGSGPDDHPAFAQWEAHGLDITSDQDTVKAGIDGEAVMLDTPVSIRVAPGALRLLVPAGGAVTERRGLLGAVVDLVAGREPQ